MKKRVRNVTLASAGIIVFILVLEISARLEDAFRWNADLWSNYSSDRLRCVDSYGVHNRFGASFEKWQINNFGFRGPEVAMTVPVGVRRIMCLGASETFGLYEQQNKEYPAQLQAMLENKLPGRFQVINAASYGTSVARATQHYQLWLAQFKPDIVALYPSPAFYLDEVPPSTKLPAKRNNEKEQFQSRLQGKAKLILKKGVPPSIQHDMRQLSIAREVRRHPENWVWHYPPPDRLELFRKHLLEFINVVRSQGGNPVLLTHAHRFSTILTEEDKYQLTSWRKFYPRADEKCLVDMEFSANEIIREIGKTHHVLVIDLDSLVQKTPANFADFVHFTDRGAKLVAENITNSFMMGL